MEKDDFLKELQDYLRHEPTLIIGSGLSCSFGYPNMQELAEYINKEINTAENSAISDEWNSIYDHIYKVGLEAALLANSISPKLLGHITKISFDCINKVEKAKIIDVIKLKDELYYVFALLWLLFDSLSPDSPYLDIITPNYDRMIEFTCELNNLNYTTGFEGGVFKTYSELNWRPLYKQIHIFDRRSSKYSYCKKQLIRIFKPHGSLGWKEIGEKIYDCEYNLESCCPAIITPGTAKYESVTTKYIFDQHRSRALYGISKSKSLIFFGYGFNDDHLQVSALQKFREGIPTLILTKTLTEKAMKVVSENPRIMAVSDNGDGTTKVNIKNEEYIFEGDYWSIKGFVQNTMSNSILEEKRA